MIRFDTLAISANLFFLAVIVVALMMDPGSFLSRPLFLAIALVLAGSYVVSVFLRLQKRSTFPIKWVVFGGLLSVFLYPTGRAPFFIIAPGYFYEFLANVPFQTLTAIVLSLFVVGTTCRLIQVTAPSTRSQLGTYAEELILPGVSSELEELEQLMTHSEIAMLGFMLASSRGVEEDKISPRLKRDTYTKYLVLREFNLWLQSHNDEPATFYEILKQQSGKLGHSRLSRDTIYKQCHILEQQGFIAKVDKTSKGDDRYAKTEKGHKATTDLMKALEIFEQYPELTGLIP
jgi:DNA-binding PadR family transcriptional regulator